MCEAEIRSGFMSHTLNIKIRGVRTVIRGYIVYFLCIGILLWGLTYADSANAQANECECKPNVVEGAWGLPCPPGGKRICYHTTSDDKQDMPSKLSHLLYAPTLDKDCERPASYGHCKELDKNEWKTYGPEGNAAARVLPITGDNPQEEGEPRLQRIKGAEPSFEAWKGSPKEKRFLGRLQACHAYASSIQESLSHAPNMYKPMQHGMSPYDGCALIGNGEGRPEMRPIPNNPHGAAPPQVGLAQNRAVGGVFGAALSAVGINFPGMGNIGGMMRGLNPNDLGAILIGDQFQTPLRLNVISSIMHPTSLQSLLNYSGFEGQDHNKTKDLILSYMNGKKSKWDITGAGGALIVLKTPAGALYDPTEYHPGQEIRLAKELREKDPDDLKNLPDFSFINDAYAALPPGGGGVEDWRQLQEDVMHRGDLTAEGLCTDTDCPHVANGVTTLEGNRREYNLRDGIFDGNKELADATNERMSRKTLEDCLGDGIQKPCNVSDIFFLGHRFLKDRHLSGILENRTTETTRAQEPFDTPYAGHLPEAGPIRFAGRKHNGRDHIPNHVNIYYNGAIHGPDDGRGGGTVASAGTLGVSTAALGAAQLAGGGGRATTVSRYDLTGVVWQAANYNLGCFYGEHGWPGGGGYRAMEKGRDYPAYPNCECKKGGAGGILNVQAVPPDMEVMLASNPSGGGLFASALSGASTAMFGPGTMPQPPGQNKGPIEGCVQNWQACAAECGHPPPTREDPMCAVAHDGYDHGWKMYEHSKYCQGPQDSWTNDTLKEWLDKKGLKSGRFFDGGHMFLDNKFISMAKTAEWIRQPIYPFFGANVLDIKEFADHDLRVGPREVLYPHKPGFPCAMDPATHRVVGNRPNDPYDITCAVRSAAKYGNPKHWFGEEQQVALLDGTKIAQNVTLTPEAKQVWLAKRNTGGGVFGSAVSAFGVTPASMFGGAGAGGGGQKKSAGCSWGGNAGFKEQGVTDKDAGDPFLAGCENLILMGRMVRERSVTCYPDVSKLIAANGCATAMHTLAGGQVALQGKNDEKDRFVTHQAAWPIPCPEGDKNCHVESGEYDTKEGLKSMALDECPTNSFVYHKYGFASQQEIANDGAGIPQLCVFDESSKNAGYVDGHCCGRGRIPDACLQTHSRGASPVTMYKDGPPAGDAFAEKCLCNGQTLGEDFSCLEPELQRCNAGNIWDDQETKCSWPYSDGNRQDGPPLGGGGMNI